jgi:enolase
MDANNQLEIDQKLLLLEEEEYHQTKLTTNKVFTKNKENLGANAILSVSLAVCLAVASAKKKQLFVHLAELCGEKQEEEEVCLPLPMFNIVNGGQHADNNLDFQEFMVLPVGANNLMEGLEMVNKVFYTLKEDLKSLGFATGVGDEGGFSTDFNDVYQVFEHLRKAVKKCQLEEKIVFAMDCAASSFYNKQDGLYHFAGESKTKNKKVTRKTEELVDYYVQLVNDFPEIVSIEDPFDENDWMGFQMLSNKLPKHVKVVGDDLFVTNIELLKQGIEKQAANTILIKPNQIGTLTETFATIKHALNNDFTVIISHRSGETEDGFIISDLPVAFQSKRVKLLKTGSIVRGERTAKYNRLLNIENYLKRTGKKVIFAGRKALL